MTVTASIIELKKTKEERLKKIKKHALKRETIEKLQQLFKNEPDFEPTTPPQYSQPKKPFLV